MLIKKGVPPSVNLRKGKAGPFFDPFLVMMNHNIARILKGVGYFFDLPDLHFFEVFNSMYKYYGSRTK